MLVTHAWEAGGSEAQWPHKASWLEIVGSQYAPNLLSYYLQTQTADKFLRQ